MTTIIQYQDPKKTTTLEQGQIINVPSLENTYRRIVETPKATMIFPLDEKGDTNGWHIEIDHGQVSGIDLDLLDVRYVEHRINPPRHSPECQ